MSTTRREFISLAATAGVGAMLPWQARSAAAQPAAGMAPVVASPPLTKFVTTLPKPGVVAPTTIANGVAQYTIPIGPVAHVAHPLLGVTPAWGYGGS